MLKCTSFSQEPLLPGRCVSSLLFFMWMIPLIHWRKPPNTHTRTHTHSHTQRSGSELCWSGRSFGLHWCHCLAESRVWNTGADPGRGESRRITGSCYASAKPWKKVLLRKKMCKRKTIVSWKYRNKNSKGEWSGTTVDIVWPKRSEVDSDGLWEVCIFVNTIEDWCRLLTWLDCFLQHAVSILNIEARSCGNQTKAVCNENSEIHTHDSKTQMSQLIMQRRRVVKCCQMYMFSLLKIHL